MKFAADFRRIARQALTGRWAIAVVAGLIAALLGAVASDGPEIKLNINSSGADVGLELAGQQIYTSSGGWNENLTGFLIGGAAFIILAALVMAVVYFVLGSVIQVGYARFNLDLVDRREKPEIGTMFGFLHIGKIRLRRSFCRCCMCFCGRCFSSFPGSSPGIAMP
jgi:hypothetical protein